MNELEAEDLLEKHRELEDRVTEVAQVLGVGCDAFTLVRDVMTREVDIHVCWSGEFSIEWCRFPKRLLWSTDEEIRQWDYTRIR